MNSLIKSIVGGAIGGVIGAVVWAMIAYQLHVEVGYVAWGVGVLVGVLARVGAGDDANSFTGAAAAIIAIASLSAGKYATVSIMVDDMAAQVSNEMPPLDDEMLMVCLADDVVAEYEQQGRAVNWPEGMDIESATEEADYPKDVWAEAKRRWDDGGPSYQATYRDYVQQRAAHDFQAAIAGVKDEGFFASFSPFDLLFFGLAVVSAYGIASGAGGE